MDETTSGERTLSDEDIVTVSPAASTTEMERPGPDTDDTDSQDADDADTEDQQDSDGTDAQDSDATDSKDSDTTDATS